MSSSNPFTSENTFSKNNLGQTSENGVMTIQGAVNKSLILGGILVLTAIIASYIFTANMVVVDGQVISMPSYLNPMMYGSAILGFILVMASYFKPTIAPITAPIYAVVEGVFIGVISTVYAYAFGPGIVFNAIMLTALCLVSMLLAYKFGIIKPTQKFRSMIVTATGAIMLVYLVNMGMHMFGSSIPYLHQGGVVGIGISLVIIAIAVLNLILDFDNIERGARSGAPKYMEWVTSLGLLVTLVWIYIEILRLLSIFASND